MGYVRVILYKAGISGISWHFLTKSNHISICHEILLLVVIVGKVDRCVV